jgi:D-alanine-D-alanine ligase
MGGPSHEHEVSLKSGKKVAAGLHPEHYEGNTVLIDKKGKWAIHPEDLQDIADVAFIAMHGNYGEDGTIQSMLDEAGIPYTGSNALSSALAMNKFLSGQLFRTHGLVTPLTFLVNKKDWEENPTSAMMPFRQYLTFPIVVKPNNNGSSVGVYIVKNREGFEEAMKNVFAISREALIQAFIRGREVTCGVLDQGWAHSAYPLLPTEIIPRSSHFFDYDAKYTPGASEEQTPARISDTLTKEIQRAAVAAHRIVGAKGFSRTDMIIDPQGNAFVLEINTIPGLTEESLLPKAALATGISFDELLHRIIQAAL